MFNPPAGSNPASGHAPARMMNDVDLCVWVADAQPGDRLVYYTGHLSRDRLPHSEGYSEPVRRKVSEIGNAAWMLGAENWVHLLQRRVAPGCWDYIAVRKAEAPKLKPVHRIIQSLAREPRKGKGERPAAVEVMAVDGGTPMATGPPGVA
ncbi:MAG: hypothetical protein IOC86_05140 [Aestuariivirga sp.]|nr:hypothetical protein [Aestuariivirga sp.]